MRTSILITLIIISLLSFLYFSDQFERETYKEEIVFDSPLEEELYNNQIAFNECEQQFPLIIPKEFTSSKKEKHKIKPSSDYSLVNLEYKGLIDLPDNFFDKSICIEHLNINSNSLQTLPKAIQNIQNLEFLSATFNQIDTIPNYFFSPFLSLLEVNLSHNKLKNFDIKNTAIKILTLYENQLEGFEAQNTIINRLDLSRNNFKKFPKHIFIIKNLYSLNLHNNQLNGFSSLKNDKLLLESSSLRELNVSHNPIKAFPIELRLIPNLSKIDFTNCEIEGTVEIDGFKALDALNINHQKVKTVILKENNLKVIDLSDNRINSIIIEGEEAGKKLIVLNLSNNPLKNIPVSFKHLSSLKKLNLNASQLIDVSKTFDALPAKHTLEHLHLASNQLKKYPNLSKYSSLININLSRNQFKKLPPPELISNYKLKRLNLSDNLIQILDVNAINPSVRELSLKGNSIQKITSKKIVYNKNLIRLDLSYNRELENFDISHLKLLMNLQELNLYATNIKGLNRVLIEQYCESNDIKVNFDDKDVSDRFFKNSIFKE
jgi:Leucine-rich repeat (LRR) protein